MKLKQLIYLKPAPRVWSECLQSHREYLHCCYTTLSILGGRGRTAQTYDEVVKDLIMSEKSYLRDLHMITKVFREQILRLPQSLASNHELDAIFSNINDITELTITLIGSLEDTLEMAEDGQVGQLYLLWPDLERSHCTKYFQVMTAIGSCFEELAEAEEFDVYEKFARDVLNPESR